MSAPGRRPGRELSAAVAVMGTVVGLVSLGVGALLAVAALTGHAVGAWASPEALSPGLIGAAMAGVAPALLTLGRADDWEEARSLYLPLVVVLTGLLAVTLLNPGALRAATGGPLFLVLFSLGWVPVVALLALASVGCLAAQYRRPAGAVRTGPPGTAPSRTGGAVPVPAWSRPLLAVLGSGWLGTGAGLLFLPGFWSAFVPWTVNRADAQGLGVWALALGTGVLASLAEDDLTRSRPALRAVPAVAVACGIVLAARAADVDWSSGGAVSLLALLGGLFTTGATGQVLLRRAATAGNLVERPRPAA